MIEAGTGLHAGFKHGADLALGLHLGGTQAAAVGFNFLDLGYRLGLLGLQGLRLGLDFGKIVVKDMHAAARGVEVERLQLFAQ